MRNREGLRSGFVVTTVDCILREGCVWMHSAFEVIVSGEEFAVSTRNSVHLLGVVDPISHS
jgi:hypothetical protein